MLQFIAPDKPIRTTEDFLVDLNAEEWSCEMKLDGYRIEIGKDDNIITARSRHNEILNINYKLVEYFDSILDNGYALDGEWINHSRIKSINKTTGSKLPLIECIGIHDVTWTNGRYSGNIPLNMRRNCDLYKKIPDVTMSNLLEDLAVFKIPMLSNHEILEFYNLQKNIKISEGIVIKKCNSKLVGAKTQSAKNPCWYKIKYRN
jgi:hypothetical protein